MTRIVIALVGGAILIVAGMTMYMQGKIDTGQKTLDAYSKPQVTDEPSFDPNFKPEVTGAPRVEVLPQDTIDYGNVKLGKSINTVFKVRNIGDQLLMVLGEPQVEVVQGC